MANQRIFYAIQAVAIKGDGTSTWSANDVAHGVQSVSLTTNFNLTQIFELGQLSIYENIEGIPDVEISTSKVLDGYPLLWHLFTIDAVDPTLVGRSTAEAIFGLAIYNDTDTEASAASAQSEVECSGTFVSSLAYNFPLEGAFTEDVTAVCNDKVWANDSRVNGSAPGIWAGATTLNMAPGFTAGSVDSPIGDGGVNQRENMIFEASAGFSGDINGQYGDPDVTVLPTEIQGISSSGLNLKSNGTDFDAHLSSITCSVDLSREELFELGRRGAYSRSVNFPVEVTCEIEATATSGDLISVTEFGILATGTSVCDDAANLQDQTIRIATCEGTRISLGAKNKLSSVNYGGGDAGGGNVTVTYSYTNFNDFTVLHSGDPNASGTAWWNDRATYLIVNS